MKAIYFFAFFAGALSACESQPYARPDAPTQTPAGPMTTDTLQVKGDTLLVEKTQVKDSTQDFHYQEFGKAETQWLTSNLGRADRLANAYVKHPVSKPYDPSTLDVILAAWTVDMNPDREQPVIVMNALAAAYGAYLVRAHGMTWQVVLDPLGRDYAVVDLATKTTVFPVTTAGKAIEQGRPSIFTESENLLSASLSK